MRNILARSAVNNDNSLGAAQDDGVSDVTAAVADEELLQLAEAMLGINDPGDDDATMALLGSLPPHVREDVLPVVALAGIPISSS